jgi:hypothetical protein
MKHFIEDPEQDKSKGGNGDDDTGDDGGGEVVD